MIYSTLSKYYRHFRDWAFGVQKWVITKLTQGNMNKQNKLLVCWDSNPVP